MKKLIHYFIKSPLVVNVIFLSVFVFGAFSWSIIGKEELPEFESNWVRVSTFYPGATAQEVEHSVTKVLEEELKSVSGIEEIKTISTQGVSQLQIVIDDTYPDPNLVYKNLQEAIYRAALPIDIRELPTIRQFKSSEKAILDIGIYLKGHKTLDFVNRQKLQSFVFNFENQLRSLKEVSSLEKSHYLKPVLNILVSPDKLKSSDLSISQVYNQIKQSNIRTPLGAMYDQGESRVSLVNELITPDYLKEVLIQGNYSGHGKKLKDITSSIKNSFERTNSIFKVNGHEAIFLNVKKSSSVDILTAYEKIMSFIDKFKSNEQFKHINIVLMDDESYAVRNRLSIISTNALVGFVLILIVLFIFLDFKSAFWVAMGVPFSLAFTLIFALLSGYTVNNMTLAAIIIVLGVVVDDAIIIAENISRVRKEGYSLVDASKIGVYQVFKPIFASIITTCLAFLPLLFFEGFFGKLIIYIPLIVCLMLFGSLFESLFILPSHLMNIKNSQKKDWFSRIEASYEKIIYKILHYRSLVLIPFLLLILGSLYLYNSKMSFVMFPREESKEVFIKVKTPKNSNRYQTSEYISDLELFISSDNENVVGVRSSVGLSRRGGETKENEASILVEVKPFDERFLSLSQLIDKWKHFSDQNKNLESVNYLRGRWGHGSNNAIEILIQESSDNLRNELANKIENVLKNELGLIDVEIDKPLSKKEYVFNIIQENLIRYKVSASNLITILRSVVDGNLLYTNNSRDEEVDVVLSVPLKYKKNAADFLSLQVENLDGNLISLKKILTLKEQKKPLNITRTDFNRSVKVYANLKEDSSQTALEIAKILEQNYFPKLLEPSSIVSFQGEIENSRKAQGQFRTSILLVLFLIFLVLLVMFNSVIRPLIILSIVPFGLASVIYILYFHGMTMYGFFSMIGAIGMIGVVVNDAIVMVSRFNEMSRVQNPLKQISQVASTRLRPIILTTLTTVVGVLPTAYGVAGNDSMLSEMMLVMGWGLVFGTFITLLYVPVVYSYLNVTND